MPPNQTRRLRALACSLSVCGLLLAGCTAGPNADERVLVDRFGLTALEPAQPAVLTSIAPSASVRSVHRDNWTPVTFSVPSSPPAHQPLYTNPVAVHPQQTPRADGRYPTVESALQLGALAPGAVRGRTAEGFVAPAAAVADLALFPARLLVVRPWQSSTPRLEPYQRVPEAPVYDPHQHKVEGAAPDVVEGESIP